MKKSKEIIRSESKKSKEICSALYCTLSVDWQHISGENYPQLTYLTVK